MTETVPKYSMVIIHPELRKKWELHGYFYRKSFISLDTTADLNYSYALTLKGKTDDRLVGFDKTDLELEMFDLYRKQDK